MPKDIRVAFVLLFLIIWFVFGTLYWYDWRMLVLFFGFTLIHNLDRHTKFVENRKDGGDENS
jgi:hypothetical protein